MLAVLESGFDAVRDAGGADTMDLTELRGKLDCIDEQIVNLYEERMSIEICSRS